jgi:hypothetical protein
MLTLKQIDKLVPGDIIKSLDRGNGEFVKAERLGPNKDGIMGVWLIIDGEEWIINPLYCELVVNEDLENSDPYSYSLLKEAFEKGVIRDKKLEGRILGKRKVIVVNSVITEDEEFIDRSKVKRGI